MVQDNMNEIDEDFNYYRDDVFNSIQRDTIYFERSKNFVTASCSEPIHDKKNNFNIYTSINISHHHCDPFIAGLRLSGI